MTDFIDPEELPFTADEIFQAARTFYPETSARMMADHFAEIGPGLVAERAERRARWRAAGLANADRMPLHAWGYSDDLLPALARLSPDAARRVAELREYLGLDRIPPSVEPDAADDENPAQDFQDFIAELTRVCPEAVDGLAVSGPPLPHLSLRERIDILRALPDNAGVDPFIRAWYARGGIAP